MPLRTTTAGSRLASADVLDANGLIHTGDIAVINQQCPYVADDVVIAHGDPRR
jgi:hypothetical protein